MSGQLYTLWTLNTAMCNLDLAQDIINAGRQIESDYPEFQRMLDQQQTNLNHKRDGLLSTCYEIASSN